MKVELSKSTAISKIKEWNKMTSDFDQGGIPDTVIPKEHKSRKLILEDMHTVFIFEMLAITVEAVTDLLCKKCHLTCKRISHNILHKTVRKLSLNDMI